MPNKRHPLGVGMTPSRTELGKFLRVRRFELGLRQIEVAKLSGIKQSHYSALEIGRVQSLKPKKLKELAKALQCEPLQIQSLIPEKPEPKTELGRLIRARRKQLELTQKEFSENSGIRTFVIGSLERDTTHGISDHLIKPLAKALGLEPSALTNYVSNVGRKMKDTDSKLGQLIRTRRKELGLSQAQLAEKLKITRQFLCQIELGQCPLSKSDVLIEQLAKILELDISELQTVRPARKVRRVKRVRLTPLGEFLTRRRLELGLSQKELAERVEISSTHVSTVERSARRPSPKLLDKLSKALGCQIPKELMPPPMKLGRPRKQK